MKSELIGYTDKFSVAPGEQIRFMVSTDSPTYEATIIRLIHADENPNGPGFKEEVIDTPVNCQYTGRKQIAYAGSFVLVENCPVLGQLNSLTLQAWIYPTTPQKGKPQGLLTKWSATDEVGYGLYIGEGGDLGLWIGDGTGDIERVHSGKALRAHQWYFVAATCDTENQEACLYQVPLSNWRLDTSSVVLEKVIQTQRPGRNEAPLLIAAAYGETIGPHRVVGRGLYNGKIDNPRIFARALRRTEIERLKQGVSPEDIEGDDLVAAWDFAADVASAKVADLGRHQLHGVAVNMPARAVTGHDWKGDEFDYKHVLGEYGAIYFHDDDLEDGRWEADFELEVSNQLKSGAYAARLTSGSQEDYIPFFVRPSRGRPSAPILFLVPTMTYLAYANERMESLSDHESGVTDRQITPDTLDLYLAEHPEFAMSLYDHHTDGSGCIYSSRLRPIVNMRPKYRMWLVGAPRHLGADLYLVDWLEEKGFAYDVVTDEDVHFERQDLLADYRVVMTGTHPEYWTAPMLAAVEGYLSDGGKVMYLGGNGFYWVTSVDPKRPHIVEVRRGIAGTRAWDSAPGECYHSTTGELGGLWRHRGKTPNRLVGVGFGAMGWAAPAPGYVRKPDSFDERAAFIFDGIAEDEIIGNFGLVLEGAAGDELDRIDYSLGTPPHALLLASSTSHGKSVLPVMEDYTQISTALMTGETANVRADMVYFEIANDGAVFSVGSICWCGSLSHNHYDNNVSRITENVLRRFLT